MIEYGVSDNSTIWHLKMGEYFEQTTCPNLAGKSLERHSVNGHYLDTTVEEPWDTFQEGWECAIDSLKKIVINVPINIMR